MDKNSLIVFGFLLLCILLSLDKKEGFATINVSSFETACNTGGNTCIVAHTGSLGGNCLPSPDVHLYNLSPGEAERDTHKESFNITADSCSDSAYPIPGQTISAQVCENEGQEYTLSGCAAKCTQKADSETGYSFTSPLPQYVSPTETDSNGTMGIRDIGGSCDVGYIAAMNTCFNKNGTINGANSDSACSEAGGIWYDGTDSNPIKLVCDTSISSNYSVIGCEAACYSRVNDLDEYMATPDDLSNPDKEIIQILHRTNPSTSETEIIMPQSPRTPYQMIEGDLNPSAFSVTGVAQTTNFSSEPGGSPIPIDFAGTVVSNQGCNLSSTNTDLRRKYPVSGLFPVCDSQTHECLNFNITYDSEPPLNITDFKESMNTSASEIGIPPGELENYRNSLYYYRRYKDRDDKIHIEGQIRCNNDPESPFHCIITDPPAVWVVGEPGQTCTNVCGDDICTIPDLVSGEEFNTIMDDLGYPCDRGNVGLSRNTRIFAINENMICRIPNPDQVSPETFQREYDCDYRARANERNICKCR